MRWTGVRWKRTYGIEEGVGEEGYVGGGEGGSGDDGCGPRGREDGSKEERARDYLLWMPGSETESVAVQSVNLGQRGVEGWLRRNEDSWSSNGGSN